MRRGYQDDRAVPSIEPNLLYAEGGTVSKVMPLRQREQHGRREAIKTVQQGRPMVYAARVAGGLIKIGCSTDVYTRMSKLHGELLAFKFGDTDDERALLRSLAEHLHHDREWFNPTPAVMAAVNEMREALQLQPLDR